jgi:hypothetical protein
MIVPLPVEPLLGLVILVDEVPSMPGIIDVKRRAMRTPMAAHPQTETALDSSSAEVRAIELLYAVPPDRATELAAPPNGSRLSRSHPPFHDSSLRASRSPAYHQGDARTLSLCPDRKASVRLASEVLSVQMQLVL